MANKFTIVLFCVSMLALGSCSQDYVPKPRGFQRFDLPAPTYKTYKNDCGFECEIPVEAVVLPDFSAQHEKCWFNIFYQPYNATLHISVSAVESKEKLTKLTEDAHTLVYKHTVKADEITESYLENEHLRGVVYEISGNTASNFQFYVTDTSKYYVRGALYFNVQTNTDSVAPVFAYLKKYVLHMFETLRWKSN